MKFTPSTLISFVYFTLINLCASGNCTTGLNGTSIHQLPPDIIKYIGSFLTRNRASSKDLIQFSLTSRDIKVYIDEIIYDPINQDYISILNITQQITAKNILKDFYAFRAPINVETATQGQNPCMIRGHLSTHPRECAVPFIGLKIRFINRYHWDHFIKTLIFVFDEHGTITCANWNARYSVKIPPKILLMELMNGKYVSNDEFYMVLANKHWSIFGLLVGHFFSMNKGSLIVGTLVASNVPRLEITPVNKVLASIAAWLGFIVIANTLFIRYNKLSVMY